MFLKIVYKELESGDGACSTTYKVDISFANGGKDHSVTLKLIDAGKMISMTVGSGRHNVIFFFL